MGLAVKIFSFLVLGISTATSVDNTEFLTSCQTFNQDIFSQLVKATADRNIIYSPFSIQTCLAMTRMGAVGKTADEMDQVLRFNGQTTESVANNYYSMLAKYDKSDILTIANKVYVMSGHELQDNYNEMLSKKFYSLAENINFGHSVEAANIMNNWVANKTLDKIRNFISSDDLSSDTRLVLLNAVYFNGKWETAFTKEDTRERDFYLNDSEKIKVEMMLKSGKCEYYTVEELYATVIRLPYKNSDLSMLVVLPVERSGLPDLEKKLKNFHFTKESIGHKMTPHKCQITLPKFKTEYEIDLTNTLQEMGMKQIFSNGANLSKMLKTNGELSVTKVQHKAIIEVSEEGTVAAAATASHGGGRAATIMLQVDHPFVYAIVNEDFVPLFQGVFAHP